MENLKNRKIINKISVFLEGSEVIVLHGSRQVGKTSIMYILMANLLRENISKNNIVYFDLEDFKFVELCNSGVENIINYFKGINCYLNKKIYLFIDEIQYLENPSSFLKLFHDRYKNKIKIIVSGSSSFEIKSKFKDSLVGRTVDFEIFTLDFEEFLSFKGEKINLKSELPDVLHNRLKDMYKEFVIYGSYPAIVLENSIEKKEIKLKQIINTYLRKDIRDLANIRDITKFNNLISILANQSTGLLNILEISNSLKLARQTVEEYLFLLESTYIIKRLRPLYGNIRSELIKMPKVFFEDTGIVNLLINKTFSNILSGFLFENSIFINIIKNFPEESIYFWRTAKGNEVDFVLKDKAIIPIEVKMNFIKKSIKNLLYFMDKYKINKGYCMVFNKDLKNEAKNVAQIYPWELFNMVNF